MGFTTAPLQIYYRIVVIREDCVFCAPVQLDWSSMMIMMMVIVNGVGGWGGVYHQCALYPPLQHQTGWVGGSAENPGWMGVPNNPPLLPLLQMGLGPSRSPLEAPKSLCLGY